MAIPLTAFASGQRLVAEHVAVILDRRAAAAGVDHHGIQPLARRISRCQARMFFAAVAWLSAVLPM
jgi:hypothetical protein